MKVVFFFLVALTMGLYADPSFADGCGTPTTAPNSKQLCFGYLGTSCIQRCKNVELTKKCPAYLERVSGSTRCIQVSPYCDWTQQDHSREAKVPKEVFTHLGNQIYCELVPSS